MTEISLHILDIAQNSIKAGATLTEIFISESTEDNTFVVEISDNGCGMDADFLKDVTSPFRTTRTTRKVGMGLSLFQSAAELTGGSFSITSQVGDGTVVTACFVRDSIDRQPLGDMAGTMATLIGGSPDVDFVYRHVIDDREFCLDTREVRQLLDGVELTEPDVRVWITGYVQEGLDEIMEG